MLGILKKEKQSRGVGKIGIQVTGCAILGRMVRISLQRGHLTKIEVGNR